MGVITNFNLANDGMEEGDEIQDAINRNGHWMKMVHPFQFSLIEKSSKIGSVKNRNEKVETYEHGLKT